MHGTVIKERWSWSFCRKGFVWNMDGISFFLGVCRDKQRRDRTSNGVRDNHGGEYLEQRSFGLHMSQIQRGELFQLPIGV